MDKIWLEERIAKLERWAWGDEPPAGSSNAPGTMCRLVAQCCRCGGECNYGSWHPIAELGRMDELARDLVAEGFHARVETYDLVAKTKKP